MSEIIQTLWIGPELSKMEQLCLKSFVDNGHILHLYTYETVKNVPEGVIIKDGNEIIPGDEIFRYKNGSVSAFSNLFRFTMLYKKGGYWVDTDLICTKFFKFDTPYVISTEPLNNKNTITSSFLKFPKGSQAALSAINIQKEHKKKILNGEMGWGSGPKTVKHIVKEFQLYKYILPWKCTCSCDWNLFPTIIDPNIKKQNPKYSYVIDNINDIPDEMVGIHLWNEMWRRNNLDKNGTFHPDSLYEQYKKKHNIN